MDVKIRKLENDMITIGNGVIIFGFWGFIKFVLSYLFFGADYLNDTPKELEVFAHIFIWSFAVLSPLVYLWIGTSARAEGKGKHKSILYLIMLGLVILFSTLVILLEVASLFALRDMMRIVVTLIIDLTRMVFLVELMVFSIRLRCLRKQQSAGEESKA